MAFSSVKGVASLVSNKSGLLLNYHVEENEYTCRDWSAVGGTLNELATMPSQLCARAQPSRATLVCKEPQINAFRNQAAGGLTHALLVLQTSSSRRDAKDPSSGGGGHISHGMIIQYFSGQRQEVGVLPLTHA